MELMGQFVHQESEPAFSELVRRHINLVYSVALRLTGDAEAHDVTQAVFVIFAKKAAKLGDRTVLTGWFYETTRFTAAGFLRAQSRRRSREQEAYMQSHLNQSDDEGVWPQLAPHLETAMSRLGEKDRALLALRFYENKSAAQAAALMNINEQAAHKRTARALEKLRKLFSKRGVVSTTAIIGAAISGNSVQAAPIGLAGTVTATAAKGAAVSSSTITLVKGALKLMAWSKAKTAIGVGVAALFIGGVATVAISKTANGSDAAAQQIVKGTMDAYAALSSYSSSGTVLVSGGGANTETAFNIRLQRPQLYHVDWTQTGGAFTSTGATWNDGTGDYFQMTGAGGVQGKVQKFQNMQLAIGSATGVSSLAASMIPSVFFNQGWGNMLSSAKSGSSRQTKGKDEKVGEADCFVITMELDTSAIPKQAGLAGKMASRVGKLKNTFWIGKQDHLIRRTRTSVTMSSAEIKLSDADLSEMLRVQKKPVTPEAIAEVRARMDSMMKNTTKAMKSGEFIYTQTQENIQVNQNFSAADFK